MIFKQLWIILAIALLSACSDTGTTTTNNPSSSTATVDAGAIPTREGVDSSGDITGDPGSGFGLGDAPEGTGFAGQLDGAETVNVSGIGIINCENNVYVIRNALDQFPQVTLILPSGASPDNFTLGDNQGDGSTASASVFFADGRVYAINVSGLVIVNDLATQAGQPVSGSFDFSASNGSNTINARGEFDFVSSESAIYC